VRSNLRNSYIVHCIIAEFSEQTTSRLTSWVARAVLVLSWVAPVPDMKVFKPKNNLMVLDDYGTPAPHEFWRRFPVNNCRHRDALIDHVKLRILADRAGIHGQHVEDVCRCLQDGANIGCEGDARAASRSKNSASALQYGRQVTDAIATWIKKGFVRGPVDIDAVPSSAKVNGIMVRPKPDGSVRVILNMSAPAGRSVNDGISASKFPAVMSSTTKWLRVLKEVGRNCSIMKIDWSDAYKHVPVRAEDLPLQWFSWLGKAFQELCLIFGTSSSVGLYDQVAKLVLSIVIALCRMPAEWICQHLDDVCAAAPHGSDMLRRFENTYRKVADQVGVRLAPTDDPEKAFSACTEGTVLGVRYNTVNWTWAIPQDKLIRVVNQIEMAMAVDHIEQKEMASICGRILHYAPLIPAGRFNLDHIIRGCHESEDKKYKVEMTPNIKRQLHFWRTLLVVCHEESNIPDPDHIMPVWALNVYTDAAGGSAEKPGRGCGVICEDSWAFIQWPAGINYGSKDADGKKIGRKLSALELVGPLMAVAAGHARCRGKQVKIWVDNIGSVQIWKKGYSTSCRLSMTLVKAISTVAASIGCRVEICKIRRCSDTGAMMADALSKAEFQKFYKLADEKGWELLEDPLPVPHAILSWLSSPREDDDLGQKIIMELLSTGNFLGYNC